MKILKTLLGIASFSLAVACNGPDGSNNTSTPENSGGEGATDITRVPGMDSSVFRNDSAGAGLDTNNKQTPMQK
ncbi:hypothetical protein [Aridibaculum aurantiacum]|uniref:hypothetical protein n=1 Tax=Aridibaculum aurantiacum TaxID=2810307 RepID=UPI001A968E06|nr:hypothetical protein [Aridibaculum aurantiacum]